jgi:hypothetical protein
MGLWHRTLDGTSGRWIQADRGALPAQSVFLTGMDVFLSILTNGKITRHNAGPHSDLLCLFPYVGPPHRGRSAELSV